MDTYKIGIGNAVSCTRCVKDATTEGRVAVMSNTCSKFNNNSILILSTFPEIYKMPTYEIIFYKSSLNLIHTISRQEK